MGATGGHLGFRLDREPWIPVLYLGGTSREVSLATLFADAPAIRDISGDIPQQKLPLLRLALAVLYGAYDDVGTARQAAWDCWYGIWRAGRFDMDALSAYFDAIGPSFDLFDDEYPFFQVAGLAYVSGGCDGVDELIADAPKPEKFLFSMRSPDAVDSLSFAEAARWLVFSQAYATAGIKTPVVGNAHVNKGKVYAPKDSVGTGWLGAIGGVFLQGGNLFETLMLNWVAFDGERASENGLLGNETDLPAWDRELSANPADIVEAYKDPGFGIGPAALMTWQSRRMRLVPNEEGTRVVGVVSCYGDILRPADMQYAETMTAWRESKPQQKKLGTSHIPWMAVQHDPSRSLWRGLDVLLSRHAEKGGVDFRPGVIRWAGQVQERIEWDGGTAAPASLRVCAQGMSYGTQNSVFEDGIDDSFDIASAMLRDDSSAVERAVEVVARTDKGVQALVRLVQGIAEAAGDKHAVAGDADVKARAYGELDDLFRDRLAHFMPEADELEYCKAWRDEVHRRLLAMGDDYLTSSGVSLFSFREKKAGAKTVSVNAGAAMLRFRRELNEALGSLEGSVAIERCGEGPAVDETLKGA